jgi:20S proteasome alpha/beta subunit
MRMKLTLTIIAQFLIQVAMAHSQTPTLMTGSTVVAVRTPSEIYVGADSRLVAYGDDIKRSTCKIRQVGNLFFAYTGLIGDSAGRFNVAETVTKARKDSDGISATVQVFEQMIVGPLTTTIEQVKRDQQDYYRKYLQGHSLFPQMTVGTI